MKLTNVINIQKEKKITTKGKFTLIDESMVLWKGKFPLTDESVIMKSSN